MRSLTYELIRGVSTSDKTLLSDGWMSRSRLRRGRVVINGKFDHLVLGTVVVKL